MKQSRSWQSTTLLLLLLTFGSFACKHTPAPPPPAPAAASNTTPAAPCEAPVVTLRADSVTVARGSAITMTWTSRNATTVDIQPGVGAVTPLAGGNRQVSPASSVTYTATAVGPCGNSADTLRVTVNEPPPPPPPANTGGRSTGVVTTSPNPNLSSQQIFERDMQSINFDYDKSDIRDDQKGKLQKSAEYLKAYPTVRVTIEGHADERGSEEYNLALGDRRANAVKQNLVSQGIAESRLSTVTYGEERPICSAQTDDCYAQNRRAAYKVN